MPGKFIVIEGIDGCGKSSVIEGIKANIGSYSAAETIFTRDPGTTELGQKLRQILLNSDVQMGNTAETLLFCSARAEMLDETIIPALQAGKNVVCDRFYLSTMAYQGAKLNEEEFKSHCEMVSAVAQVKPDFVILLDAPAEVTMNRIEKNRTDGKDRIEKRGIDYMEKVRQNFQNAVKMTIPADHYAIIDASQSQSEVQAAVSTSLDKFFQSVTLENSPEPSEDITFTTYKGTKLTVGEAQAITSDYLLYDGQKYLREYYNASDDNAYSAARYAVDILLDDDFPETLKFQLDEVLEMSDTAAYKDYLAVVKRNGNALEYVPASLKTKLESRNTQSFGNIVQPPTASIEAKIASMTGKDTAQTVVKTPKKAQSQGIGM